MTLQQIRSFIIVAESGSFNKAEKNTFLTKQALKKHVDCLESEMAFTLIRRSQKGIQLTPAGKMFYDASKESLERLDQLIKNCRNVAGRNTCLRIGNPPHPRLLLENAINKYADRYPDIHLDIIITKNHLAQKVSNHELDVAEFIYRPQLLMDGISYKHLCTMRYACVMNANHPLAEKKQINPLELTDYLVGMNTSVNIELYNDLRNHYPSINIQNMTDSAMHHIMNICFDNGIYISKAYFTHQLLPLVTIPLDSSLEFDCGVIYRTESVSKHSMTPVSAFLELLDELYEL